MKHVLIALLLVFVFGYYSVDIINWVEEGERIHGKDGLK